MIKYCLMVAALLCATATSTSAVTSKQATRSIENFQFISPETTLKEVTARLGKPDKDIGSGLYIYVYYLSDSTHIVLGSDGQRILYAKHVTDTENSTDIFAQKK